VVAAGHLIEESIETEGVPLGNAGMSRRWDELLGNAGMRQSGWVGDWDETYSDFSSSAGSIVSDLGTWDVSGS